LKGKRIMKLKNSPNRE